MRRLGVLAAAACAVLVCARLAAPQDLRARGPWPLVAAGPLGTVTWRCDPQRSSARLALGFQVAAAGQTGSVRLSVRGRTILRRVVQPGQTLLLPFLRAPLQRVDVAESGEDGTLRMWVTVDFTPFRGNGFCWPYLPPRADLHLLPRS